MSSLPPPTTLPTAAEISATPAAPKTSLIKAHKVRLGIAGGLIALIGIAVDLYHAAYHETTDDAYTTGHIHNISSRVTGTVIEVAVDDNEFVKKGQMLVRLDPRDYQKQVDKARADYDRARADFERADSLRGTLHGDIAISKQEYDQMQANLGVAKAALDDALDQLSYCTITAPEMAASATRPWRPATASLSAPC